LKYPSDPRFFDDARGLLDPARARASNPPSATVFAPAPVIPTAAAPVPAQAARRERWRNVALVAVTATLAGLVLVGMDALARTRSGRAYHGAPAAAPAIAALAMADPPASAPEAEGAPAPVDQPQVAPQPEPQRPRAKLNKHQKRRLAKHATLHRRKARARQAHSHQQAFASRD
jgi:hypothetical protein